MINNNDSWLITMIKKNRGLVKCHVHLQGRQLVQTLRLSELNEVRDEECALTSWTETLAIKIDETAFHTATQKPWNLKGWFCWRWTMGAMFTPTNGPVVSPDINWIISEKISRAGKNLSKSHKTSGSVNEALACDWWYLMINSGIQNWSLIVGTPMLKRGWGAWRRNSRFTGIIWNNFTSLCSCI